MYAKYQTDALIIGNRSSGESDKLFSLYTREFGLVRARCTGVRAEKSRMRYALQSFAHAQVALVRGAHGWRVVGAIAGDTLASGTPHGVAAFVRIAQLVERLVAGEEKNEHLFNILTGAHMVLRNPECGDSAAVELVAVARILHTLGYLSGEALQAAFLTHTAFEMDDVQLAEAHREALLSSINRALSETHL